MTDRPIIFSGPMVRALIAGRKTQTRRLATSPLRKCEPGDRLWVRENHQFRGADYGDSGGEIEWFRCYSGAGAGDNWDPAFPVGWEPTRHAKVCELTEPGEREGDGIRGYVTKLLPSIHMPRWASRLTLIVEAVRVEPLQAISRADAIAEGLTLASNVIEEFWRWPEPFHENLWLSPPAAYRHLWQQLHTTEGQRWDDNPDVLVLTFWVERANIDQVAA